MLNVIIIATGACYQKAAAFAAMTYRVSNPTAKCVVFVALPVDEEPTTIVRCFAARFGFRLLEFPFRKISDRQITTQIKTQALCHFTMQTRPGEINLYADADTFCLRPILIPEYVRSELRNGKVGLVRDTRDGHAADPGLPWYVAPEERLPYVNSGVIFAGRRSISFFEDLSSMGHDERFLAGRFNEQKIINYLFARKHREALLLMDRVFNGMRKIRDQNTIIGHNAGGAGGMIWHEKREKDHLHRCKQIAREFYGYAV